MNDIGIIDRTKTIAIEILKYLTRLAVFRKCLRLCPNINHKAMLIRPVKKYIAITETTLRAKFVCEEKAASALIAITHALGFNH